LRLKEYLSASNFEPVCPNSACAQHGVPLSAATEGYRKYGQTEGGSLRWKCKSCGAVFSQGSKPTQRQRITHKNREIFVLLINKMPMRRMLEVTGLDAKVLYGKLAFIHRQSMAFAADRERRLLDGTIKLPKMYVAVDRQHYIVNWSSRKDRRNVQLTAIASADLASGYVFGFNLSFDSLLKPVDIEAMAIAAGDYDVSSPYRRYARVWLQQDYVAAVASSKVAARRIAKALTKARITNELEGEIAGRYADALQRNDIEVSEEQTAQAKLPDAGMQVHEQYTLYGHFFLLRDLLASAPKIRVYMDQDSGFRAAFLATFHDRIKSRTGDGYYVSVMKESTIDEKDKAIIQSRSAFVRAQKANPGLTKHQVEVLMVKQAVLTAQPQGPWNDIWVEHPFPNKSEPQKRVCWVTDMQDYTEDHAAELYLKGTLHPVDRFFMQTRRKLSLAERPYASANNTGRKWHGYSAYNPAYLARTLETFRVAYNYCVKGKDGKTPAMRLGLARGPVELEKILAFDPFARLRKESPVTKTGQPVSTGSRGDWLKSTEDVII
jgi:transposase-like protein